MLFVSAKGFSEIHRDWIYEEMKGLGIALGRYFGPIHLQPAYNNRSERQTNTCSY